MSSIGYLRELLSRVEPEREIWFAPGRGSVCARDVDRFVATSGDVLERVQDRNVALYAASEVELAPLLVLLDGTCRQLTLLPSNLPPDRLAEIVVRSGSEILVTTDRQAVGRGEFEVLQVDAGALWAVGRPPQHMFIVGRLRTGGNRRMSNKEPQKQEGKRVRR